MGRGARALLRAPRKGATQVKDSIASVGATTLAGISAPAPPSPFNVDIGPHRRYTWVDADLAQFKAIKDSLGGTLNDVVLASVSLALGRYLRAQGHDTEGLVLKAMVPVSVRADVPARRARQPGRRDVGAAAGRRREPGRVPGADPPRDGGSQAVRPGRRARRC